MPRAQRTSPSRPIHVNFARSGDLYGDGEQGHFRPYDALSHYTPDAIGLSGSFIDQGIQIDLYSETPGGEVLLAGENSLDIAGSLPEDTLLMISSTGIKQLWQRLRNTLKNRNDYRSDRIDQAVDALEDETGISLEEDIIGELIGEIAIAVLPSRVGIGEDTPYLESGAIEGLALAQVGDTSPFHTALEKLDSFLEEERSALARRTVLGEYEAVTLDLGEPGEPGGSYSPGYLLGERLVVLGTTLDALSGMVETIEGEKQPLGLDPEFSRLTEMASDNTSLVVFADTAGLIDMVVDSIPPEARAYYEDELSPFLDPFRTFFAAGASSGDSTVLTLVLTVAETR